MLIPAPSSIGRKLGGVYHGWKVVAAAFVVNAINDGTFFLGFSVLFLPISRDLKLSRAATSLPFTLNELVHTVAGPFLGYLIDRFGPPRVLMYSCLVAGLGFLLLAWTKNYVMFVLVLVGLISLGMMGLIPSVTAAVVPWFVERRSMAMAISNSGWSMGGAVGPPLLAIGVVTLGWRWTAAITGIGIWLVILPLTRVFQRSPDSTATGVPATSTSPGAKGPVGAAAERTETGRIVTATAPRPSESLTVGAALRSPYVWILSFAMGLNGMIIVATSVHFVAIMTWKGLEEATAGILVGVWAFIMTPMMLGMGWMGDRWSKERISALGLALRAAGWILLLTWMDGHVWQMLVILVLLAPDFAIASLTMTMIADRVGPRNYATIVGITRSASGFMTVGSPYYAGWVFDRWESYTLVVLPAIGMTSAAALIFWFLPNLRAVGGGADSARSG